MTLSDIIHPTRLKILEILGERPKALADIAVDLDLSKPEISRHLAKMRDLCLAEKEDKLHRLTSLGGIILNLTSPIEFLIDHYDYFMHHKVDLPLPFIRDIDSLMNGELMSGQDIFLQKPKKFVKRQPTRLK